LGLEHFGFLLYSRVRGLHARLKVIFVAIITLLSEVKLCVDVVQYNSDNGLMCSSTHK